MACLITFKTSRFDVSAETPNPINPIAGESVLKWLREALSARGYQVDAPASEDWGWYTHVTAGDGSYLVGAMCEYTQPGDKEWMVQIEKRRSFTDKLFARNKMSSDDALAVLIVALIREDPGSRDVQIDFTS